MCGIHVYLNTDATSTNTPQDWLKRRGPDHMTSISIESAAAADDEDDHHCGGVTLQASVLQMRESLVPQPVCLGRAKKDQCDYLAWNGEVYQLRSCSPIELVEETWDYHQSDTELVAQLVRGAWVGADHKEPRDEQLYLLENLSQVMGRLVNAEYAFCVVSLPYVFYGRDVWGRRSLVIQEVEQHWQISSVVPSTGSSSVGVWREVPPGRVYCYSLLDSTITYQDIPLARLESSTLSSFNMDDASQHLERLLLGAIRRRLQHGNALSILFSGGVDSVVLAALSLELLDPCTPLYLINVEFVEDQESAGSAADTLAAQASFEDLIHRYPQHSIRFVPHQVKWTDIRTHQNHIQSLLAPKTSVMDLNIGAALWFAAGAAPTRVVLTGLGADEQMGGYGRHRKAWDRGMLREELDLDLGRLWERNLGRDDRVLSDHGKEARFPYLDTAVVEFLQSQSLDHICDFSLPPGQGDKRILRLIAERLGCTSASAAVKRAIQFGSRIAQVSDKQRFGSRRKASGEAILPQT